MVCNMCGRNTQNEEANFCEYCGSPFREQTQNSYPIENNMQNKMEQKVTEKPIPFSNWLVTNTILFSSLLIPWIGPVIAMVFLIIMSVNQNSSESKKNWARSTLLCGAVYLIIILALLAMIMNSSLFKGLMNGTIDYNSLGQSLNQ